MTKQLMTPTVRRKFDKLKVGLEVMQMFVLVVFILMVLGWGFTSCKFVKLEEKINALEIAFAEIEVEEGESEETADRPANNYPETEPADVPEYDPPDELDITSQWYNDGTGEIQCDTSCWHEVAHSVDSQLGHISQSEEFQIAVAEFLEYNTYEPDYHRGENRGELVVSIHPLVSTIVNFPCFFRPCSTVWADENGEGGAPWGGWNELYAELFDYTQGRRDDMPRGLRSYYDYDIAIRVYREQKPEHINADFCMQWALGWDYNDEVEERYNQCMVEVRQ